MGRVSRAAGAIAWPIVTYAFVATTRSSSGSHGDAGRCGLLILELLLPVLAVLGTMALVCAAKGARCLDGSHALLQIPSPRAASSARGVPLRPEMSFNTHWALRGVSSDWLLPAGTPEEAETERERAENDRSPALAGVP